MDIVLNRQGGTPLRDQIVAQVELKILAGELCDGQRLPSVRGLAARLGVNPRTVHAAYRQLQANHNLELHQGSGAYVRRGCPGATPDGDIEPLVRGLLAHALRRGFTPDQVRVTVRAWLERAPPSGTLVVDSCLPTAEILAAELRHHGVPSLALDMEAALREPARLAGSLVVVLPFHADRLRGVVPSSQLLVVSLEIAADYPAAIRGLPPAATILVVSHSPRVPPYARSFLQSLRGHDVVVDCHLLGASGEWQRLVGIAELVLADLVAVPVVAGVRRDTRVLRLLGKRALSAVQQGLAFPLLTALR